MLTNADRAEYALKAVNAFWPMVYANSDTEDLQTQIKDLITNLCHLARRECGVQNAVHFVTLAAQMHDIEESEDEED